MAEHWMSVGGEHWTRGLEGCGESREGVQCWRRVKERVEHWTRGWRARVGRGVRSIG